MFRVFHPPKSFPTAFFSFPSSICQYPTSLVRLYASVRLLLFTIPFHAILKPLFLHTSYSLGTNTDKPRLSPSSSQRHRDHLHPRHDDRCDPRRVLRATSRAPADRDHVHDRRVHRALVHRHHRAHPRRRRRRGPAHPDGQDRRSPARGVEGEGLGVGEGGYGGEGWVGEGEEGGLEGEESGCRGGEYG